jgi:translation initiation factor 2 subunit 1
MRRQGYPKRFELVVCRIVKIFPHSALAELVEYRKKGLIHVSEVALRWVRNIREFIKLNQFVVCQVMRVDGEDISLSVKRVRKEETERRLNEFKRERKAEKALELTAKGMKKSLDDAYDEVGYILQEEFGSIYRAFEFAVKNPDFLKSKNVPKEWLEPIIKTAQKSVSEKEYEVKAKLDLRCYSPDGVETIKKALLAAGSDGLEVRYVSAPRYVIIGRGKNFKKVRAVVQAAADAVSREISASKGTCEVEIKEGK